MLESQGLLGRSDPMIKMENDSKSEVVVSVFIYCNLANIHYQRFFVHFNQINCLDSYLKENYKL